MLPSSCSFVAHVEGRFVMMFQFTLLTVAAGMFVPMPRLSLERTPAFAEVLDSVMEPDPPPKSFVLAC